MYGTSPVEEQTEGSEVGTKGMRVGTRGTSHPVGTEGYRGVVDGHDPTPYMNRLFSFSGVPPSSPGFRSVSDVNEPTPVFLFV